MAAALAARNVGVLAQTAASQPTAKRQQFVYVLRVTPKFQDPKAWTDRESAIVK